MTQPSNISLISRAADIYELVYIDANVLDEAPRNFYSFSKGKEYGTYPKTWE